MTEREFTAEQREALDAWAYSMSFNAQISEEEARSIILGWLQNGMETEVRDLVTLQFKPHTLRWTWHNRHWCPGYYDCLYCAG